MEIERLSSTPVSGTFLTDGMKPGGLSSDDLLVIGMHIYFKQLHQIVMEAWGRFRESQSKIKQQKDASYHALLVRRQQEEAARLIGELRLKEPGFHDGNYLEHRHLNLAV